jgi:negative regulator of flagellin synthesis FlgM
VDSIDSRDGVTLEQQMKIEGNRPRIDTTAAGEAEKVAADRRTGKVGGAQASSCDSVEVSADAKLLSQAMKAAQDSPDIRVDVVERMREKLAAGTVGNDSGRLADRLIDDLLKP